MSNGILLFLLLLFLSLVGGYLLKSCKCEYLQEAGLAVIIGLLCGAALKSIGENQVLQPVTRFNVEFFLLFLLPPIIFESGFNLNRRAFYQNIGSSLIYAFLGTLLSALSIGLIVGLAGHNSDLRLGILECASFATLISSTDTVSILALLKDLQAEGVLYNMLLGESIFNDAVVISLYRTIILLDEEGGSTALIAKAAGQFALIFLASTLVGISVAFVVSFVTNKQILKRIGRVNLDLRHNLEASCVIFGPWISYLIAEALSQSGIVSILLCGLFMAHYTRPNLSAGTLAVVGKAYSICSHAAENLVFIFLGMGVFSFKLPFREMGLSLIITSSIAILIGRMLNIAICSALVNVYREKNKLNWRVQVPMWFAGPRGAIAFALAVSSLHDFRHGDVILSLTLVFSVGSILVVGVGLAPLVRLLGSKEEEERNAELAAPEECGGKFKHWMAWLDEAYLYPFFVSPSENESPRNSLEAGQ